MSRSRRSSKQLDNRLALAESPVPIVPRKPKGVPDKPRKRIDFDKLRAELSAPRPSPPSPSPPITPRRRRKPEPSLFITRAPPSSSSPLKCPTERMRRVTSPYVPSFRPQIGRRLFSGPVPGIIYDIVPQNDLYPLGLSLEDRPFYLPEDDVVFGRDPSAGCCINYPDSVSKEALNIRAPGVVVCFQWKGYEEHGVFSREIVVPSFQDDPFSSRLTILAELNGLFQEFRNKVAVCRNAGEEVSKPVVDVLAFGNNFRVTRLERRYESSYQAVFTYPRRNGR